MMNDTFPKIIAVSLTVYRQGEKAGGNEPFPPDPKGPEKKLGGMSHFPPDPKGPKKKLGGMSHAP
jgi:hypothetical protein